MLLKIIKLTFYPFLPNPDLLFYYAKTDTKTLRGIATPELAEDLVTFFESDESFECEIEKYPDGSFKLIKLLSRPTETPLIGEIWTRTKSWEKQARNKGEILVQPKQITIFKRSNKLKARLICENELGLEKTIFVDVDKSWVIWYLLMLRKDQEVILAPFKNFDKTEYYKRNELTYIDNPKNFACANVSPDLKRPIWLSVKEPKSE